MNDPTLPIHASTDALASSALVDQALTRLRQYNIPELATLTPEQQRLAAYAYVVGAADGEAHSAPPAVGSAVELLLMARRAARARSKAAS